MRGLWRQDRGEVSAARAGQVLAQQLPQVLLLRSVTGRAWNLLLYQGQHDPLQGGLHKVRPFSAVLQVVLVNLVMH